MLANIFGMLLVLSVASSAIAIMYEAEVETVRFFFVAAVVSIVALCLIGIWT